MRLATFNLLHGISLQTGQAGGDELRAAVRELAPDVLGLQEADFRQDRSGGVEQVRAAAEELGAADWRFVPSLVGTPGLTRTWRPATEADADGTAAAYGIGLVSRWPVVRWAEMRFSAAPFRLPLLVPANPRPRLVPVPDEPRAAVAAVVETPYGRVSVVTAHLSFVPGYNLRQLRRLALWARAELPAPRVLLGDFNLPGPLPQRVTGWQRLARVATYPSYAPRVQFDHVLGDGLHGWQVGDVQAPRLAVSDHTGLVVQLVPAAPQTR
ncbi:endonuclease [Motilibacter sp. E257]|uniref:Endonuclease n=1 Tax=Motilibacter deserti TaxID=2714956 RepID=A0ABX0GRA3_9ACTN|nr:endonuclease/exonuclease/phosphatase family protein [Motilibacter deserti]NHC13267.1 endonuclease [Motilibacter deserti]